MNVSRNVQCRQTKKFKGVLDNLFPHEVYITKKQPLSALPSSGQQQECDRRVLRKCWLPKNQHLYPFYVAMLLVLLTYYGILEIRYAQPAKFLSFAASICRLLMMIISAGERWEFREALCVISPMSGI